MSEQNEDFIGKRVNDVKKIFGLAERDFMALLLVFSVVGNITLVYLYIDQNKSLNEQIVDEVRRQVDTKVDRDLPKRVEEKVEEAVQPMKEGVKQAREKVDTILERIKP